MHVLADFLAYWSATAAETLWKATLILGGAALAAALFRNRSAATRHLIWTIGVISVLALPALRSALPLWKVGLLPADRVSQSIEIVDPRFDGLKTASPSASASASASASVSASSAASTRVAAPLESAPLPFSRSVSLGNAVFIVWLTGVFAVLAWVISGVIAVRVLVRRARSVSAERWLTLLADTSRQIGLRRPVRLLQAGQPVTPMTFGVAAPAIVLPANANEWTDARRRVVLLHELAHVERRDVLTQLVAQLACALYWFHPLVWHASRRLRVERERACDDAVVSAGERASDYAAHLLDVARAYKSLRGLQPAALAMARSSQLEGRLLAVLKPGLDRARLQRRQIAASLSTAVAVMIPISALTPIARSAEEGPALQSAEVYKHPRPNDPLSDRWSWAFREARARNRRTYWVAYSIRREAGATQAFFGGSSGAELSELSRDPLETQLFGTRPVRYGKEDAERRVSQDVALLFEFRQGANDASDAIAFRIHTMRVGIDLKKQPVFWLGGASDAESIPWIAQQYEGSSIAWLRDELVEAVGVHQDAGLAVPFLQRVLDTSASPGLRTQAVEALGEQGSRQALDALLTAVRSDESQSVRREAAEALGEFQDVVATRTLFELARSTDDVDVRNEAAEALGQQRTRAAAAALEALIFDDGDDDIQQQATEALGEMPELGLEVLKRVALTHPRWLVRAEAVEAMADLSPDAVLPTLESVIYRDADPRVQEDAAETLGDLGRAGLTLARRVARDHPNEDVREKAAEVVADYREKDRGEVDVDTDRIRSNSNSASPSLSPSVSRSPSPSPAAAGDEPWDEELQVSIDESQLITDAQARRAPDAKAILALRANLNHVKQGSTDLVRERSVWALSLVRNGEVVRPLIAALRDPDWHVRAYAAWALTGGEDPRATQHLLAAAHDEHWRVRMHAIYALARVEGSDQERMNAMIANLDDENWQVRYAAAENLGAVGSGPDAEDALRRMAADPRPFVRDVAAESLRKVRSGR